MLLYDSGGCGGCGGCGGEAASRGRRSLAMASRDATNISIVTATAIATGFAHSNVVISGRMARASRTASRTKQLQARIWGTTQPKQKPRRCLRDRRGLPSGCGAAALGPGEYGEHHKTYLQI